MVAALSLPLMATAQTVVPLKGTVSWQQTTNIGVTGYKVSVGLSATTAFTNLTVTGQASTNLSSIPVQAGKTNYIWVTAEGVVPLDKVTVAWDPNPENDIAGYNTYLGFVGTAVTNKLTTTNTEQPVINMALDTNYWFYVTAFNTSGLESDPSIVLTYQTKSSIPPYKDIKKDISLKMNNGISMPISGTLTVLPVSVPSTPPNFRFKTVLQSSTSVTGPWSDMNIAEFTVPMDTNQKYFRTMIQVVSADKLPQIQTASEKPTKYSPVLMAPPKPPGS